MKQLFSTLAISLCSLAVFGFTSVAAAGPQVKIAYDVHETKFESDKLDLIFVVDDSGSMEPYQQSLEEAARRFGTAFDSLQADVHAAVITTSMSNGNYCQSKVLCDGKFKDGYISNRSGLRFSDELAARLRVGTQGDATETVFAPLLTALEEPLRHPENAGFLRADARLVIVFVTDAEEQSQIKPSEFAKRVVGLKGGQADRVSLIGALLPSGQRPPASCTRDQGEPVLLEEGLKLLNGTARLRWVTKSRRRCSRSIVQDRRRSPLTFATSSCQRFQKWRR